MENARRSIRVLAVDDDEGIRFFLSLVLTEENCRVLTAPDGMKAREILDAEPVNLLITDYCMPRMNGLDLIRWSKTNCPQVEVVMITGHDDPVLAAAARACGALRVFPKPFPVEELLTLVGEIRQGTPALELAAGAASD